MVKKTPVTKLKKAQKKSTSKKDKGGDSRCTPKYFRAAYDSLCRDKMKLVKEMCLGAFKNLPTYSINHKLLIELVRSYDLFNNTISTGVGQFLITTEKIRYAFGLNSTGDAFEDKKEDVEDELNDEEKEAYKLFKGKRLKFIEDILKTCKVKTEREKRMFKRAFDLFIQKSFLCPASSANISPKHLPVIRDIENTHNRNWAHHVNTFLVNGIMEFKEKQRKAVKGFHFVLMIIYFKERFFGKELNNPKAKPPWISYWNGENLRGKNQIRS
ncbi:hypothetical protein PIB30_089820 [Stylosanthes scabra]|uniref:Uncharacterized protein n=1 Tax=Stylosanthes scabra TaxID=79078 RepID=A0ABU6RU20_9FABA|nr:hypothetical protein [Stylosanthes scabra]